MMFATVAILLSAVMWAAWAIRMRTGQSGWIDAFWSFATGIGAVLLALSPFGEPPTPRQWLCAALVGFWSVRLGSHIARRAATSTRDDPRYAWLAKQWGDIFPRRLFLFLQIQALCAFGLAASVWAAAHNPAPGLGAKDAIGVAMLAFAVIGEGIADAQIRRFAADPANHGKVCDAGLWGWSRHPNYFFEWFGWLGYLVIAIAPGWAPGWIAAIGPLLMYGLLVHASGIPPLEQHMLRSRGDAFRAYQARVSAFFPLPPRS